MIKLNKIIIYLDKEEMVIENEEALDNLRKILKEALKSKNVYFNFDNINNKKDE